MVAGTIRLWWARRRSGMALVWNKGGLAYRASPKVHGVLLWRRVSEIEALAEELAVLVTEGPPDHGPDFTLTVNTAGTRSWQRWPARTQAQHELIDTPETSRTRGHRRVSRGRPAVHSGEPFPRAMDLIWARSQPA